MKHHRHNFTTDFICELSSKANFHLAEEKLSCLIQFIIVVAFFYSAVDVLVWLTQLDYRGIFSHLWNYETRFQLHELVIESALNRFGGLPNYSIEGQKESMRPTAPR